MRVLVLTIFFLFYLSGCASNINNEASTLLIGKWNSDSVTSDNVRVLMDVEYLANGTCDTHIVYINTQGQKISYYLSEYWSVENNKINYKVFKSSNPDLIGGGSSVEIISIDKNSIKVKSSSTGHISELKRKL